MARPHHVDNDAHPDEHRAPTINRTDLFNTECETPPTLPTPPSDPHADWWAGPGDEVEEIGTASGVLERPLMPLQIFMSVMGVGPPAYHAHTRTYSMRWVSSSGMATVAAVVAIVALTGVATLSLGLYLFTPNEDRDHRQLQSLKTIGVLIVGGYQVNALVQVLNTAAGAARHARLLSSWTRLAELHHINPTRGLRWKCCVQVVFMTAFIVAMLTAAGLGRPRFITHMLEGLAERLYLVPRQAMHDPTSITAKVRPTLTP